MLQKYFLASHFRLRKAVCLTRSYAVKAAENDCIYDVSAAFRLALPLDHSRRVLSRLPESETVCTLE